jgi:DNA-binding IclR family transcriptional regulator
LEVSGYVRRVGLGSFALSLKVVELAGRVLDSLEIRTIGHDMLVEVNRFTDLAAHLAVREGLTAVVVDRVESAAAIRLNIPIGRRMPLYAGASSKVLLAYAPPEIIEAILSQDLQSLAAGTVTSREHLVEELPMIRKRGYARSDAEVYERARAIAAPIYNARGDVVAALSVGGLARRIKLSDRAIIDEVQAAALSISANLGYQRSLGLVATRHRRIRASDAEEHHVVGSFS